MIFLLMHSTFILASFTWNFVKIFVKCVHSRHYLPLNSVEITQNVGIKITELIELMNKIKLFKECTLQKHVLAHQIEHHFYNCCCFQRKLMHIFARKCFKFIKIIKPSKPSEPFKSNLFILSLFFYSQKIGPIFQAKVQKNDCYWNSSRKYHSKWQIHLCRYWYWYNGPPYFGWGNL